MAKVIAVCISDKKGEQKIRVEKAHFIAHHGIEGDAHAGNWHRQVSLLGVESVKKIEEKANILLPEGSFAENVLIEGLCLYDLPVGALMQIGESLCCITQIGKECHNDCIIRQTCGDCVMPREGIFVEVLESGWVRKGDTVEALSADKVNIREA